DAPFVIGTMNFDNLNSYSIVGGNTLTIDTSGAAGSINVASGSHSVSAPLSLAKDTTINVGPAGSTLMLSNLQSSTGGIPKVRAGTLAVTTVRAGSLTVNAGKVSVLAGRSTAGTSNVTTLSVAAGASLDLNDQDMVVNYTGSSPIDTIFSAIQS